MDVAFDLARHIVNTKYEQIPTEVVSVTKKFVIDSIGVGIAGTSVPGNAEIIELLQDWGGKEESRVLVYGFKIPAPEAAFANSLLIHSADYDDTFDKTATHTNVTSLPAALATAEQTGCDGEAFITAIVLGVDLTCRLALTSHLFHGWHNTTTVGIFGATVAAAKILGLDETQTVHALGIAYSQAAGNRQGREDGAQTKRLQPAFSAKAGVISALLARQGVTGAHNIFQGQWGFFRLYHDPGQPYEPEKWAQDLVNDLGTRFEGINLGAKPYPCVRCAHAPVDAAIKLALENDIDPEDIAGVTVYTNERVIDTAGGPFEIRSNPEVGAKFSIPYTVAVALSRRKLSLDDFREETIMQPELIDLAGRVAVVVGPEFADSKSTMGPVKISIKFKNGTELSQRAELASGHPQNPMSRPAFIAKFNDCVKHSIKPIPEPKIDQLLELLNGLETVTKINAIAELTMGRG